MKFPDRDMLEPLSPQEALVIYPAALRAWHTTGMWNQYGNGHFFVEDQTLWARVEVGYSRDFDQDSVDVWYWWDGEHWLKWTGD